MTYPRSPFDRSVADTLHWARFIDKARQQLAGDLPDDYALAFGHPHGLDGQFLSHFDLTIEQVSHAVAEKTDSDLALWLEQTVESFPSKRDSWNKLAPDLGRQGHPMDRSLKIAIKRIYTEYEWSPETSVFELIDLDEGRL
ncbi:MAG: DUF5069 domain-containing protein [Akkermansiaceae bacterium]